MSDERCDVCDSRRHVGTCTGFPGAVYVHHGQGWFPWEEALALEDIYEVDWDDVWSFTQYGLPHRDRVVIVDTETTGLDPTKNEMVEIAWYDCSYDSMIHEAVVPHTLADHSPEALRINRYMERGLDDHQQWCAPDKLAKVLSGVFDGAIIAGSNVPYDQSFIEAWGGPSVASWDHRKLEIGSAAMGFLQRRHPLRLREVSEALGLSVWPDHTAKGDVLVVQHALTKIWGDD